MFVVLLTVNLTFPNRFTYSMEVIKTFGKVYYTAALTSLSDSVSYVTFLFSEWRMDKRTGQKVSENLHWLLKIVIIQAVQV